MKAAQLKAAADHLIKIWLASDCCRTEYSTRDYTAALYKDDGIIIVTYMDPRSKSEWPKQKVFNIAATPRPVR